MLKTKSILSPVHADDGLRISIMSRHTLPDGVTIDPRINRQSYDEHWVELAPPEKLVGAHYKRGLSWQSFRKQYLLYLRSSKEAQNKIAQLIALADQGNVTVLCIESSEQFCHRKLLAQECHRHAPTLKIDFS